MKKLIKSLLLITWMVLIYYLSSQTGDISKNLSDGLLFKIASFLKLEPTSFIHNFSFVFRKLAHFSEYFILYLLTNSCFKEYGIKNAQIASLVFCVSYALIDEIHQLFVNQRSGELKDVLIDSFGAICAYFLRRLFKK